MNKLSLGKRFPLGIPIRIPLGILLIFGIATHSFGDDRFTNRFVVDNMYGKGQGFLGAELGFLGVADYNIGIIGGYQYYFKEAWQFAGFRHGIRGIGNISFGQWKGINNYNLFAVSASADWTIEFTPYSRYDWGAFAGLGILYLNALNKNNFYSLNSIYFDAHIGGSLNIDNTHRVELAIGSGLSVIALRYMYMF